MELRFGCSNCPFPYSNVAISTDLNSGEALSTPRLLSSRMATITELLIQNPLFDRGIQENRRLESQYPASAFA
jgi:hypothetical protein